MVEIAGITFTEPLFLSFALLAPLVWLRFFGWRREAVPLRGMEDYRRAFGNGRAFRWGTFFSISLAIVSLACVLAGPRTAETRRTLDREGIDIAVVMDISKSMLAEDMSPNRMTAAKKVLSDFVGKLDGDRIALVLFAGKPFVSVPLTFDYAGVESFISRVSTDSIEQSVPGLSGTAMGDGMLTAMRLLDQWGGGVTGSGARERVMILVTDGEANVGLDPKIAGKLAAEKGIRTYSIGMGSLKGTPLYTTDARGNKRYFRDQTGQPILADLDEKTLTSIAESTGGKYFRASDTATLASVFDTLAWLDRRPAEVKNIRSYRLFVFPFLVAFAVGLAGSLAGLLIIARAAPFASVARPVEVRARRRRLRLVSAGLLGALALFALSPLPLPFVRGMAEPERSILFVLDVSHSMDARDMSCDGTACSRLSFAKRLVAETLADFPGSSYGLVAFAGEALTISPATHDVGTFSTFLSGLDTDSVSLGGTDLLAAVRAAGTRLGSEAPTDVVLLTDAGDDGAIDEKALKEAVGTLGSPLLLVGLGSEEGARIPVSVGPFGDVEYLSYGGNPVIARLNEPLLKNLANGSNVRYLRNPETIGDALRAMPAPSGVPSRSGSSSASASWETSRRWLAFPLLLLFALVVFVPDVRPLPARL